VFARLDHPSVRPAAEALGAAGLHPLVDPPRWHGEGALWAAASGAPLLSFVGTSPLFHTPADVPENTTSPSALAIVHRAVGDAIEACLAAGAS
jgi:hypothetical protein